MRCFNAECLAQKPGTKGASSTEEKGMGTFVSLWLIMKTDRRGIDCKGIVGKWHYAAEESRALQEGTCPPLGIKHWEYVCGRALWSQESHSSETPPPCRGSALSLWLDQDSFSHKTTLICCCVSFPHNEAFIKNSAYFFISKSPEGNYPLGPL